MVLVHAVMLLPRTFMAEAAKNAPKKVQEPSAVLKTEAKSLANTILQRVTRSGRVVKPTEKMVQWKGNLESWI